MGATYASRLRVASRLAEAVGEKSLHERLSSGLGSAIGSYRGE